MHWIQHWVDGWVEKGGPNPTGAEAPLYERRSLELMTLGEMKDWESTRNTYTPPRESAGDLQDLRSVCFWTCSSSDIAIDSLAIFGLTQ